MPKTAGARFAAVSPRVRTVVLIVLGALAALGQAPFNLWPLTILCLAVLLHVASGAVTPRQQGSWLWLFGVGYFALSLHWIVEPFLVDVARHGWMAPFALILMASGAALFWALAGWFAARLAGGCAWMLALTLTGAEVLRALILTGFPWALLGHVWLDTGVAQLAAWGGPHLLTLLLLLVAGALAALMQRRWVPALVVLAGVAVPGVLLLPGPPAPPAPDAPIVRLVQPNAPQDQKWDVAYRDVFYNRLLSLSAGGPQVDLVVWPETAVPYLLRSIEGELPVLADAAQGAPLVFGIQRRDEALRAFNSLVVLGPYAGSQTIYDKQHLVPFGEYIPGAALVGQVGAAGLARSMGTGFTPGDRQGPVDIPGIGAAVPLICYEGIFAEEIRYGDTRPRLLLLITNDAWFGNGAGPRQHLAQARLRAIEQGLPMVRVANTGISAMIDGQGRITASLPLNTDGALDTALPAALLKTVYARFGDIPVVFMLIFLIAATYVAARHDSD